MIQSWEAVVAGRRLAKERGQCFRELFGAETLESENARRLVARSLRKQHPDLSFEAVVASVEEALCG